MGAHEPLYRGCPSVMARPTLGRARVSLVPIHEVPAHFRFSISRRPARARVKAEVRGISATNIVPAYVATNNGRDEQLFLANGAGFGGVDGCPSASPAESFCACVTRNA